jgi:hypothetical protein
MLVSGGSDLSGRTVRCLPGFVVAAGSPPPPADPDRGRVLDGSGDLGFSGGDGEVSVEKAPGGGEVWTVTAPYDDGVVAVAWERGPASELRSYAFELVGVSAPNLPFPGFTSGTATFTLVPDHDPILAPNPDERPDPARFRVPDDLMFGSD